MKRLPLFFSFLAVLALSASITYWSLQFSKKPAPPLAPITQAAVPDPLIDAAASLFGGQATVVASNYQLKGVVAANRANEGVAIISADGKAPVAVRVGKDVVPGVSVKEVQRNYVTLSEGGVLKRIDLAVDAKAGAPGVSPAAPMVPAQQMPAQVPPPPAQPQMPPPNMNVMPNTVMPPPSQ
jgi:general secretion pathway protein C